ncbi:MAG: hypothetical protein HYZ57_16850 [Acidobacteria bacterium]|nr:hypothetical protein [Acidobacteriota bacterium]MBI3281500.1 hypothetical protein [Acidobacteriota bacterium]
MRLLLWLASAAILHGQAPPLGAPPALPPPDSAKPGAPDAASRAVLENAGKPMRVQGRCGIEEINALGLTCSVEEPCPIYLELASAEAVGSRILLSGNLHTSNATIESILLASDDAGKTWTEAFDRMPLTGLDHIRFIDFETGWISGQTLGVLPRDPFFLISGDGGKTWRKRPVFGETRVGTIEQFHFDSRTNGAMLLDRTQSGETGMRYEFYETMNSGDTWMLRQVSARPIPFTKTAPDRLVRLRAEARSKSIRVERKSGERWTELASFLIAAGECKPEASPPPPPPEPESATEPESAPAAPKRPAAPPSLRKPR